MKHRFERLREQDLKTTYINDRRGFASWPFIAPRRPNSLISGLCELAQGQMLYLAGGATHALRGIEDSSVIVTILLR